MVVVIADISNANPGTERRALDFVRNFCASENFDIAHVTFVCRPEHSSLASECPSTTQWSFASDVHQAVDAVTQRIRGLANTGASVRLLTFTSQVKALARVAWPGVQVDARNLVEFGAVRFNYPTISYAAKSMGSNSRDASAQPRVTVGSEEPEWAFDHVTSLDIALETLFQVLRDQAATSVKNTVRQTQLRPLMGWKNLAFSGNAASTRSGGMIGILLRIAASRGLIGLAGAHAADLFVWLTEAGERALGAGAEPSGSHAPAVAALSADEQRPPEPKNLQEVNAAVAPQITQNPQATAELKPTEPGTAERQPQVLSEERSELAARHKQRRDPEKYKPHRYSQHIINQRMGPFPVPRPSIYDSLLQLDAQRVRLQLHVFVTMAVKAAIAQHPNVAPMRKQLEQATQQQLLRARVALDEHGRPLPDNWKSGVSVVDRLAPNAVKKLEAEILATLLAAEDITGDDVDDIARCLYGSADEPTNVLKVHDLLKFLIDNDRVYEDKRGVFRVKEGSDTRGATASPAPEAGREAQSLMGEDVDTPDPEVRH
jgi:hypothetical protein